MVTEEAGHADTGPARTRLFTTWLTSRTDDYDHAVTDEEFTAHTPEPEAVCRSVILLAPMEWAPSPRCPDCVAVLNGPTAPPRADNPMSPWVRLIHSISAVLDISGWVTPNDETAAGPCSVATRRGGRPKPPAKVTRPGADVGDRDGDPDPVSVPAHSPPVAVSTTGAQRPACQQPPDGREGPQDTVGTSARRRVLRVDQLAAPPALR